MRIVMPGYRALIEQAGYHVERHETTTQGWSWAAVAVVLAVVAALRVFVLDRRKP